MTSDGSLYSRLQSAIRAGNLPLIHATGAELGWVPLKDALAILLVIDDRDEERFASATVRWAGRLALEVRDSRWPSWPARSSRFTHCRTSMRSVRWWR
jgi:hypothetical protein